jgi:hypothetical protein
LLNYCSEQASGCRVARVAGVESEADLPFAVVQELCTPMVDRLEGLPGPQQDAPSIAFGTLAGPHRVQQLTQRLALAAPAALPGSGSAGGPHHARW